MFDIAAEERSTVSDEYDRKGVVQIQSLLGPDDVVHIREAFMEQVIRDNSIGNDDGIVDGDPLKTFPRLVHPHRRGDLAVGELARQWMLDPRIIDRVTDLIGPAFAAQSMFYFKPPGARGQALHQDNLFLAAHPETCLAVWIAIDDCDEENGGLMMVPGSHRFELVCPGEADQTESFTSVAIALPDGMTTEQSEMKAGDVLFFHGSMVHGSGPNRSHDRFRRSLIFHYVPQSSTEIARFYNPLLAPNGDEVIVSESADGGACGEGWVPAGPH